MVLTSEENLVGESIEENLSLDLDVLELSADDEVNLKVKKHSLVGKAVTEKNDQDKRRVVQQGPWTVMDSHLILKEWPVDAVLEEIDFSTSEFWVQVHKIPLAYLTKANAEKITSVFQVSIFRGKAKLLHGSTFATKGYRSSVIIVVGLTMFKKIVVSFMMEGKKPLYGYWLRAPPLKSMSSSKNAPSKNPRKSNEIARKTRDARDHHLVLQDVEEQKHPPTPASAFNDQQPQVSFSDQVKERLHKELMILGPSEETLDTQPPMNDVIFSEGTDNMGVMLCLLRQARSATQVSPMPCGKPPRSVMYRDKKAFDPIQMWNQTLNDLLEFEEGTTNKNLNIVNPPMEQATWQPPPHEVVKLNCDASFSTRDKHAGISVVCRNSNGALIGGASALVKAITADVAEAMAVRLACSVALKEGWDNITIESDTKELVKRLLASDGNCR
ncbi:hypothetical protein COLO4_36554 [Corchorus olitorius]|uniref:RNase H type-1 domain-containing protein n=1 Tax=Corchorus olitorius TaxID=93759 RepID=A0A1R3G809_9ROSI|nr:hypothetical protein COLO4_36554 [Corchorus olitorius]